MSRFRSSFEVAGAVAHATALAPPDESLRAHFPGVSLTSFTSSAAGAAGDASDVAVTHPAPARKSPLGASDAPAGPTLPTLDEAERALETLPKPPKLPDLSRVASPVVRCEKIIDWIVEATGALNVFLADAAGLPIAGALAGAEPMIANAGLVASAVSQLAAAIPGNPSAIFEMHLGEGGSTVGALSTATPASSQAAPLTGPFFQLVGFQVGAELYLAGLTRASPLSPRQAHAVRLACAHALDLEEIPARAPMLSPSSSSYGASGGDATSAGATGAAVTGSRSAP